MWPGAAHEAAHVQHGHKHGLNRLEVAALTLFFGLQAGINYTIVAWLPSLYLASGFSQHASSALIALFLILQTSTSLFFPVVILPLRAGVAGRSAERRVGQECVITCISLWSPCY